MKTILSVTFAFILTTGLEQSVDKPIRNIDYYNSLRWKDEASLRVYVDCTYTLPTKPVTPPKSRRRIIFPYRYYPYSRYSSCYDGGNWFLIRTY